MLMRNDRTFRDCSALQVTCFKIDMITTYFWPPIRFFASHALKDDLTQVGIICSHFTLQMKYLVSLLWKPPHRLLVSFGTLESKTAHFCTFYRHLQLSSDFRAVFYSFSFRDNFYPESHSIRRAACFWHDEKITVTKEILDWNFCQVTVTVAVFLQSRSSIYIFTDSLFFLLCLFSFVSCCVHWAISQFFPWGSLTQMAGYNQEFRTRLIADGFAFSFG